jgi:hypothetical protein
VTRLKQVLQVEQMKLDWINKYLERMDGTTNTILGIGTKLDAIYKIWLVVRDHQRWRYWLDLILAQIQHDLNSLITRIEALVPVDQAQIKFNVSAFVFDVGATVAHTGH